MTQSNFNHLSLKFCKTLATDIPVYDWRVIQSFCLILLSVLRKKEGKGEGRTGLKSKSLIPFYLKNEPREKKQGQMYIEAVRYNSTMHNRSHKTILLPSFSPLQLKNSYLSKIKY